MTPTLWGRIETRWLMIWTIGIGWVLLIGDWLPGSESRVNAYIGGFASLLLTAVVGTVWETIYHGLQQFRWDKDWPTGLGLIVGLPEGVTVYYLLSRGIPWSVPTISVEAFVWQFGSIWVLIWCFVNGPIRIFFPRWRFAGGRFE